MQHTRILVVDDETGIRSFVAALLKTEGYEIETAGDGGSALAAIRTRQPDLVLLDIGLPVLTGDRVLQQLRTENMVVPVIIMTAGPVKASWYWEGNIAMLPKPFELNDPYSLYYRAT